MDPAFLVWIPPLEEGDILKEIDENKEVVYQVISKYFKKMWKYNGFYIVIHKI